MLQIEQIICGSSSVRATGVTMGILSLTPVELTGEVKERDTDSIGRVLVVELVTAVVILVVVVTLEFSLTAGGPPFNNCTCSATISGS